MSKINITLSRIKHPIKFNIIIRFLINTISKSFLIIVIPYLIENMLLYINSKDELESVVLYISKILIFMLVVLALFEYMIILPYIPISVHIIIYQAANINIFSLVTIWRVPYRL